MLNNITFNKGQGGLGRPLSGKDFISSLLFYTNTLPSGFTTSDRVKAIFAVSDAESLGIKSDNNDETQASGVFTISAVGANGNVITLNFTEPDGKVVQLGTYTKTATESTTTLVAAALVANINLSTATNGYSATNTAGAITITVRKGLGIYPNTGTPLAAVTTGTIAGSVTTGFAGGVASNQAVWHYHISEFFRMQPKGKLWLGFYAIPSTFTFEEIKTIQDFSNGEIRQMGVYKNTLDFQISDTTTIQGVCTTLENEKKPLSVLYAPNIISIGSLGDLSTLNNPHVSVVISQDAGGLGHRLYHSYGLSISTLGASLGTLALASVHQSIAWVGRFNISNGVECEKIGFSNGTAFTNTLVTENFLSDLNNKRYVFLRKFPDVSGSYFNDSHTATAITSDYAYIENNRVIDKAIRGVYADLLPDLNSPLLLKTNGTLANTTVAYLEGKATNSTNQMIRDGEVSAVEVLIDTNEVISSTSTLKVTLNIVPIGVARNIIVNISFKATL